MPTIIRVSVGIITQGAQLLICQRRTTDLHASKWEFPGGKAQDDEDDATCLQRELREELQIDATVGELLGRTIFRYPNGRTVALTFFHVPTYTGGIVNTQFQELIWVKPETLLSYDFLEGDRNFVTDIVQGRWPLLFTNPQPRTPNPR
ncbi:MAG: (deoxy)nucleoside triphosphate pyrophosphohydrolase [Deltaproteobacteria bacterium]|nr:(deoxy)nucleoside triphosphate pyrophosphohydrolase [Deltaproteobacteria bacterium]